MTSGDNKGMSRFWAYRYHIHLDGKAIDLHVACFKEMIHRSHGMLLPPIKTPLLKLTTMHGMPPRRAADGSSAMDDKQQKTPTICMGPH